FLGRPAAGPPLFPYTTLFRSRAGGTGQRGAAGVGACPATGDRAPRSPLPVPRLRPSGGLDRRPPPGALGPRRTHRGRQRLPLLRSEEHTSELQSLRHLVCRLL